MDLKGIEGIAELIKTVSNSNMTSIVIKEKDLYIKMKKEKGKLALKSNIPKVGGVKDLEEDSKNNTYIVKSPIIGSFYLAPAPDKKPYVKVGSKVKKGDILCIIEAMKLMNEITSDVDGKIVKIYPKDGDMVEYGQNLFEIIIEN